MLQLRILEHKQKVNHLSVKTHTGILESTVPPPLH